MASSPKSGSGDRKATAESLTVAIDDQHRISGLLSIPAGSRACFVMGHGAGAGMTHPFLARLATDLAAQGIATLRYQFPYMEEARKRPDSPMLAHATIRAVVAEAVRRAAGLPLFAGGKSFGGRMTSQAQALQPLDGVRGLIFLGFPLHPAGRPSIERARHLADIAIPMLFLQGTRDQLAGLDLLAPVLAQLGNRTRLEIIADADHGFHVRASSGTSDQAVRQTMALTIAAWIDRILAKRPIRQRRVAS
jgi:predicted alpha/beta-hydrolase family hydrolase